MLSFVGGKGGVAIPHSEVVWPRPRMAHLVFAFLILILIWVNRNLFNYAIILNLPLYKPLILTAFPAKPNL